MSNEKLNMQSDRSCGCPFCDDPICPDPTEESYACSAVGKTGFHKVDCVGLYCPVPVMRAKEEIDLLEMGNLMELVADDPASVEDIPRWAKRAGHILVKMWQDGSEYHFLVQKNYEEVF
ncbi:MAG TPA: sulfurtransferase TusA family protein [Candidatus Limnocylindrales bacterium]|nr:sulfurtransferase TusA family protein [Candidatus Limnocylindrales bacterium]